jgi:hypothetical protein
MSLKNAIIFFVLFGFIIPLGAVQQSPHSSVQALASHANLANLADNAQIKHFASADDAQSLQNDIKRMRVLVQQMQNNLAFVDNSQSPLKHQFELEIEMWKVVISDMERRSQMSTH